MRDYADVERAIRKLLESVLFMLVQVKGCRVGIAWDGCEEEFLSHDAGFDAGLRILDHEWYSAAVGTFGLDDGGWQENVGAEKCENVIVEFLVLVGDGDEAGFDPQ